MDVNEVKGRRAEQSEVTRGALLAAARALFAERGYAAVATEEIVRQANVTRGALYHHFANKEGLFRAVLMEVEHEIGERVATAAMQGSDPLDALRRGCQAFLDSAMDDPSVRRIVLLDAPAVLGWQAWRDIEAEHGIKLMKEALASCEAAGLVRAQPLEPLAHMLIAALNEAALLVANAKNRRRARAEVGATVDGIVARLANR